MANLTPILDPHLHFFALKQGQYHWLREENPPAWPDKHKIRHDFHENDLTLNQSMKLTGFVHIEAGFDNAEPWQEVAWLESSCTLPFKSVAGIDLTLAPEAFKEQIERLADYPSVVGCRHILDDQANALLIQKKVQENLAYLAQKKLSFELQMPLEDQAAIKELVTLLHTLPDLRVIINHAGWPPLDNKDNATAWKHWRQGLSALSQFQQCAVKCSGWEMADRQYTQDWQEQVIDTCLKVFGEKRVMLASNFPLTLFSQDYEELWQQYIGLASLKDLSQAQIYALTHDNAAYWYQFES